MLAERKKVSPLYRQYGLKFMFISFACSFSCVQGAKNYFLR
jgi:hypothetical protein